MTDNELDYLEKICNEASVGPWRSTRDGNQYIETHYMPTAECVGASFVSGLIRPWNPHAMLTFGMPASEYEVSRFLDCDADFIAAARKYMPEMIKEIKELKDKLKASNDFIAEDAIFEGYGC